MLNSTNGTNTFLMMYNIIRFSRRSKIVSSLLTFYLMKILRCFVSGISYAFEIYPYWNRLKAKEISTFYSLEWRQHSSNLPGYGGSTYIRWESDCVPQPPIPFTEGKWQGPIISHKEVVQTFNVYLMILNIAIRVFRLLPQAYAQFNTLKSLIFTDIEFHVWLVRLNSGWP